MSSHWPAVCSGTHGPIYRWEFWGRELVRLATLGRIEPHSVRLRAHHLRSGWSRTMDGLKVGSRIVKWAFEAIWNLGSCPKEIPEEIEEPGCGTVRGQATGRELQIALPPEYRPEGGGFGQMLESIGDGFGTHLP